MVYKLQLTYDEIIDKLDVKYITGSTKGNTLPPGINENLDNNFFFNSLHPKDVKVNIASNDIRLKSNSTLKKQLGLPKNLFSM